MRLIVFIFSFFVVTTCAQAQSDNKLSYPFVIEFYSIGAGVRDNKPVFDFIRSFKKQQHIKRISLDKIGPLGREGEYDLCFNMKEMNKRQKGLFIERIKRITAGMKDRGGVRCKEHFVFDRNINSAMIEHQVL